jgi:hypothetical protein
VQNVLGFLSLKSNERSTLAIKTNSPCFAQFDLFPTNEPEIKVQLAAFAVVLRGLIEAMIAKGQLTPQQAAIIIHKLIISWLRRSFVISWNKVR